MIRLQRYMPVSQELGPWESINPAHIVRLTEAGNGHVRIIFVGETDRGAGNPEYIMTPELETRMRDGL